MIDYNLRFNDEAEATAFLAERTYLAVDVIGQISLPTGNTIETEQGPMPETAPISGWHVNVRHTEEAPELEPFRVHPQNPVRVWA
jgi:hypothetical protein